VQVADQQAQRGNVAGIDRVCDLLDEIGTDRAILAAQRRRAGFLFRFPFGPAGLGERNGCAACTPGRWDGAND
jgi:hypothetical protein